MKRRSLSRSMAAGATALVLGATLVGAAQAPATETSHASMRHSSANGRSRAAVRLRNQMRKLWEDHIVWTRQFIVSAIAELPDTDTAAGRLLANQDHIGDAIKPYYGDEAGEQLSALLRDHILIAADLVGAAKSGDTQGVDDANARWHENSDEIADFLHAANPSNWPAAEMRSMMSQHLDRTLTEASSRLNGDWEADVAAYDQIHRDILHMADMLSRGIIAQFPGRF